MRIFLDKIGFSIKRKNDRLLKASKLWTTKQIKTKGGESGIGAMNHVAVQNGRSGSGCSPDISRSVAESGPRAFTPDHSLPPTPLEVKICAGR